MTSSVHLCGSVPFTSTEAVFINCASILGPRALRLPDGEVGNRLNWIKFQLDILVNNADLEIVPPKAGYVPFVRVRPRTGIDLTKIVLADLGYAKAATESWTVFEKLVVEGKINPETRFQVSLPTPIAVACAFVAEQQDIFERCYETKLLSEINEIVQFIPNKKLSIQLDICMELGILEKQFSSWFADTYEEQLCYIVERIATLAKAVPDDVEFGIHLCYGDREHKHFMEPKDTSKMADLIKSLLHCVQRPITYFHLPVPRSRHDVDYFLPLQSIVSLLTSHKVQLFLGLVHLTDGESGAKKRIDAATKVVKQFGVSTECGLGRRTETQIIELLTLMRTVSDLLPQ